MWIMFHQENPQIPAPESHIALSHTVERFVVLLKSISSFYLRDLSIDKKTYGIRAFIFIMERHHNN
jgi:hypothetical protein